MNCAANGTTVRGSVNGGSVSVDSDIIVSAGSRRIASLAGYPLSVAGMRFEDISPPLFDFFFIFSVEVVEIQNSDRRVFPEVK